MKNFSSLTLAKLSNLHRGGGELGKSRGRQRHGKRKK